MSQSPLTPTSPISSPQPGNGRARVNTRFTPLDHVRVLRQYIWVLVIALVVGIGLGVVLAYLAERYTPTYTSETQLMVTGEITNIYETGTNLVNRDQLDALKTFMRTQVIRITSPTVLNAALSHGEVRETEWLKAFEDSSGKHDYRKAAEALRENLDVQVLRGSTLISVEFSGQNQYELPKILDTVRQKFLDAYNFEQTDKDLNLTRMMTVELRNADAQRKLVKDELDAFRKEHDITRLTTEDTQVQKNFEELTDTKVKLEGALRAMRLQYNQYATDLQNQQNTRRPEEMQNLDEDERIKPLTKQKDNMLLAKDQLSQKGLGENHDMMRDIDRQIVTLDAQIARKRQEVQAERDQVILSAMQKQIENIMLQINSIDPELDEARTKLQEMDMRLHEHKLLDRRREVMQTRYERAEELLENMRVKKDRPDSSMIQVVQQATLANLTFPNYPAMIVGVTLLVVALTAGAVFLKELLDQRIKSPTDLFLLPDATLLGIVPVATDDPSGPATVEGIVHKDPAGLMAEAFRQVRIELLGRMDRRGYKTLMLVGAQPECGTSAVVSNLGASMTLNGRRVLLIDANMRRPGLCRLFSAKTTPGLVEVLKGDATFEQALVRNGDPRLDLLPAGDGHATPPEILESAAMRNLLSRLESEYDTILIDAPPVLVASDARLLCKQVDAVALVVRAKAEKRGMIGRVLRELEGQRADVLGVILNGVHLSAGGYFRKNYQAFYQYRQGNGQNGQRRLPTETEAKTGA